MVIGCRKLKMEKWGRELSVEMLSVNDTVSDILANCYSKAMFWESIFKK